AFENELRKSLGFRERLTLMIEDSHNGAASSCVMELGFKYINGALRAAGFLDVDPTPPAGAGLWLGGLFGRNAAWANVPKGGGTLQGSAKSAAAMMALIADDDLVDDAFSTSIGITTNASAQMRTLLRNTGSNFRGSLDGAGRGATDMLVKLGDGD